MSMLKVEGLNVYYGSIHAIKGVSFEVPFIFAHKQI